MKKSLVLLLTLIFLLAAANLQAATVPCPITSTTLSNLVSIAGGGNTCTSQDKIYSNFSSTLTAAQQLAIAANIHLTVTPGGDQHGWSFSTPGLSAITFTLAYTISTDTTLFPTLRIVASVDQIVDGTVPYAVTVADTQTPGTLNVSGATLGSQSAQLLYPGGFTTINTSSLITIGAATLDSYEQIWIENNTTTVPEPASLILLGTGLLGVGLVGRRFKR